MKKEFPVRRFIVMCLGILIMGVGVALFKLSCFGNDPSTALAIAVADRLSIDISIMLPIVNSVYFIPQIIWGRKLIGAGTFVNWFCVGFIVTAFSNIITPVINIPSLTFWPRLVVMLIGVLVLSFSCALYQTADLGVSPYDSLSIMMDKKLPIPYFWCRIITDSVATVIAFSLGGIIGIGTLTCALGLGPFIAFFTKYAAKKLCGVKD